MSQPDATTPAIPKGRRRSRWLCAMLLLATIAGLFWWRVTRLNDLEQQFVGQWTKTEQHPDGSTLIQHLTLRRHRTAHLHTSAFWAASRGMPQKQEYNSDLSWAIVDGQLQFDTRSLASGDLRGNLTRTLHRARNRVFKTSCGCDRGGQTTGRLSRVGADTFSVSWLYPEFGGEKEMETYVRVVTGVKP